MNNNYFLEPRFRMKNFVLFYSFFALRWMLKKWQNLQTYNAYFHNYLAKIV